MKPLFRPEKSDLGWEIFDGFAFEHNPTVYKTKRECQVACDEINGRIDAWNRAGLADAPHMDNF